VENISIGRDNRMVGFATQNLDRAACQVIVIGLLGKQWPGLGIGDEACTPIAVKCTLGMPASGRKKPKWSGKSLYAQATVSPLAKSSASKSTPSVARMNFAFAFAVAGLSFSAVSFFVTCPESHVVAM